VVGQTGIPSLDVLSEPPKRKRNPLVLAGAMLTAGVLARGIWAFRQGNSQLSARMMSWRIYGQGATVAIILASMYGVDGMEHLQRWGLVSGSDGKEAPQKGST